MKKICSTFLLICMVFCAAAQDISSFSLQVKAGIQLPGVYGREKDSVSMTNKTGLVAGLSAVSPISRHFVLKHDIWAAINKDQSRLDVFPISAAFRMANAELFAGPYAGMLLRADNYGNGSMQSGYATKNDIGFTIGAGYTFRKKISIDVRYVRGMITLIEDPGNKEQLKAYRQYVAVTLGYVLF
ncbi:PorT family protein [Chitinophaga flava]|nr:PorT family protein [Chitinophaga flava]